MNYTVNILINFKCRDIYKNIKNTGTVRSSREGLQKVLEAEDGNFALFHDAKQVFLAL